MANKEKTIIEFEGQIKLDSKDADNKLSAISKKEIIIPTKLDINGLKAQLAKVSEQKNLNDTKVKVEAKLDLTKFRDALDKIPTTKTLNSTKVTVEAKLDLTKLKDSIKDINKTVLNVPIDQKNLFEVEKRLAIIKNQINGINNMTLNVDAKVKSKKSSNDSDQLSTGTNGSRKRTKNDLLVDDEYQSLLQKRNIAFAKADKAWQESKSKNKNTPNYNEARQEFEKANKEYVEFAQKTGKLSLSSLIKQYENMLGSDLGKKNPLRDEIERLWKEAIKRQDELAKELASKNPLNQRKKSEKGREAVIKEAYAQDAHQTKLLELQAKAVAKAQKELEKTMYEIDKHNTQLLIMQAKAVAKAQAELEKAQKNSIAKEVSAKLDQEKYGAKGGFVNDALANLRYGLSANLSSKEIDALRNKVRSSLESMLNAKRADIKFDDAAEARLLGKIAGNFKFDTTLFDEIIKKGQEAKQRANEVKAALDGVKDSAKGSTGAGKGNNNNTAQTFAAEAKRYAAEAEKAWRDAGNRSTPEFEKLRKQFMNTMDQMVRFRREIGDLSAGQAAGVYSKMASSLGKLSPLYDGLIKKARELNKEQARVNQEAKGDQSGGRWFGGAATYMVHFLGRSSKGFGSFGEAVADLAAKLQGMGGHIGRLGTAIALTSAAIAGVIASLGVLKLGFDFAYGTVTFFGNILQQIGTTIYNILKPGIELYKQQTSAIFSFTASLKSNAKFFKNKDDTEGKALTTPEARGLSRDIITRATLDAEMSAFSLEELLRSLQGTLPILLSKGFSLDQAYEINKGVAGVAKQIQLTPSQILQETRDLAQGSITARGSQVANALGISNQDIAKYKGDVEGLFKFLMGKFKEYSELLSQYEDTALGRWQQLQERWQSVTRTMVDGVADQFQSVFETFINSTGNWVDKEGNKLNAITGKWEDENGASYDKDLGQFVNQWGVIVSHSKDYLENVGKGATFKLSGPLEEAQKVLKELVTFTLDLVDSFAEYVKEATNGQEPMEVLRDVVEIIEIIFVGILEKIVDFCSYLVQADGDGDSLFTTLYNGSGRFFQMLEDIYLKTRLITLEIQKWAGLIEGALLTLGIGVLTGGVGTVAGAGLRVGSKFVKPVGRVIGKATESGIGKNIKDGLTSGFGKLLDRWKGLSKTEKRVGVGATGLGLGSLGLDGLFEDNDEKIQKEIDDLENRQKNRENNRFKPISSLQDLRDRNASSQAAQNRRKREQELEEKRKSLKEDPTKDVSKVKGTPSSELSDKERNKQIQEAQKAMRANIQELKDGLKDFITDLKDALEKNKIAYDEGFMSMQDYFNQKAEIERQEAEAKLQEAQAELAEIQKTPFKNEDDQRKEISKLNREIKQYTRELNKAAIAQQEVARNMERFTEAQKASYAFMSNNLGKGQNGAMVGQKVDPASFDALMSFNPDSLEDKIAWAMQMAMLQGFDKDAAAGIVGNWIYESGGNLNPKAVGDSGSSYGIAQWHNDDWVAGDAGHGRWKELIDWANANNSDWTDFRTQVLFGLYELTKGREKGNYYANNGNWKQQARNYTSNVERPSASAKESSMSSRISYAGKAYELGGKQLVYASNNLNSAANNLNNSSNNLVDSSGKLLGYVPEDQYSRGGIDTRYSDFQDMSSGVDAQIAGLDKKVAQVFNLFAKKYYEKTNEKVLWTSFTGDMRPGYHNPHASGESGHRGGKKGDFWVNNQSVAAQIAKEIGLALSFEIDHYDMSAHGGVYSPGLLTPNQRADDLWSKLQQSTQQANSAVKALADTDLPDLSVSMNDLSEAMKIIEKKAPELGALMPKIPNTTNLGHESFKVSQEYLTTYFEKLFGNGSRVTGNLKAQLAQEYTKLILNVVKYRSDPMMLEQILVEFKDKVNDKMVSFAKEMADYNLKVIEENAVYRGTDMMAGKFSFEELTKLYNSYFSDLNNNLGVAKYIDMLEKLYAEFEAKGFTKEAFEIRNYLNGLKQRLVNLQKSWIDKISDFYDRQQSLFDATEGFTNLQREFGTRELKAYKAQANYEAYSIQLEKVNEEIAENNKKLEEARELLTKCAEGTKEWAEQSSKVNYYSGESSRLEALRQEYEYQKKLNDLQRKQPEYLRDLRNTARQALEDGLVTFLTDGVNEAKNLGEALRNLAVSFLKEIQKVSAKWMVKSLMTKLFGHYYMDGAPNVSNNSNLLLNQAEQQTILQTRMVELLSGRPFNEGEGTFSIGGYKVGESEVQPWVNHFGSQFNNEYMARSMGQLTNPFNGVPTQTWSFGQYVPPQSVSFNGYNVGSDVLQQFNQKLQESSTISLPNFANNISQATQDVTKWSQGFSGLDTTAYTANAQQLGQAMEQASISVSTASTEMQTSASTMTTGLQTAFMELEVQARSAARALQRIAFGGVGAFAEGGYISGPGTSTSDSIPAMLSSGEYVIKASSVRKYGTNFLNSVNNGNFTKIKSGVHHYAEGGLVSELAQEQTARGMGNFGRDISNNISNTANINVALVRDEREGMKQLLKSPEGQRIMLDFSKKYASVTSRF